jgi:hypothetical protein
MGLKIIKSQDSVAGCYYVLDMGLLCNYRLTFGITMAGGSPVYVIDTIVHGKTMRRAYKQQGRMCMDEWSGE